MNTPRLRYATFIGTLLQAAMVIAGHFVPLVKSGFMFGGLALSLVAGVLYGARAGGGFAAAAAGGALAGGACALIGILLSFMLGDVTAPVIAFGTVGSAVSGLLGALVSRAAAKAPLSDRSAS
jgi:hypothetical protein